MIMTWNKGVTEPTVLKAGSLSISSIWSGAILVMMSTSPERRAVTRLTVSGMRVTMTRS